MNGEYPIHLYFEKNCSISCWVAEYLDLPGCRGVGNTKQQAIVDAEKMKDLWLENAKEAGKSIPIPRDTYNKIYSGRFNQRVSKDLHRRLVIEAELQEVSLNSLCERYFERGLEQDKLLSL